MINRERMALNDDDAEASEVATLRGLLNQPETLHASVLEPLDRTDDTLDAALAHFAARHE